MQPRVPSSRRWRYALAAAAIAAASAGTYAAWPWLHRPLPVPAAIVVAAAFLVLWAIVRRNGTIATLRASEAQFRTTFESAPIGIALVDMTGRPVRSNAALQQMLGYTGDELARLTFPEFTHPDDVDADWHLFEELIAGRRNHYQLEKRYRRADGLLIWAQLSVALLREPGGRPAFALGMVQDITERKRAEQALRASEARLGGILDIAQDAVISVDESQQIILFNKGAEQIFGYQAAEVLGRPLDILLPPSSEAHREHVRAFAQAPVQARRMGARPQVHGRRKDGTVFPAEASISKLDHEGRLVFTTILRDVSERVRAEETLRQAEERLRLVVSNLPIVLWVIDAGGRFTLSEGQGLHLLGLQPGEVVGRTVTDVYAGEPDVLEASRRALEGESVSFSVTLRDLAFECWYSPLHGADGQAAGAIGVAIDVTERQRLQAQLLQSTKMEAIGRLAGGIAHDFNNLLTAIFGYTEFLMAGLGEQSPHQTELREIRRAAASAAALTRQLLAFSRKQILQPVVMDLNACVQNLEGMLRRLIGEDVAIVLRLAPDLGLVHADPAQIEQVILNLAVNARDAMPTGGTLTIETADIVLTEGETAHRQGGRPGPYVRLRIVDTGLGMTPEVQAHAFEPFFTTKERGKGTGLGLSTVYGIVKQSGGRIAVESAPGRGSTFLIDLPRVDERDAVDYAAAEAAAAEEAVTRGVETVLLVEDDDRLLNLGRRALERHGYTVLMASDPHEALEIAARHETPIQLLLTDVVMPGMNGRELAEQLLLACPGLRVLYTSGYTEHAIVHQGVLRPGTAFLPKPFTPDALAREVRRVLDSQAAGPAS